MAGPLEEEDVDTELDRIHAELHAGYMQSLEAYEEMLQEPHEDWSSKRAHEEMSERPNELVDRSLQPIRTCRVFSMCTDQTEGTTELDSHADTCVVGGNALQLTDYGVPVRVTGYDQTQASKVYETVSAVVAYDHPVDGNTYMLVMNQAIMIPQMNHNLLCPMQLRQNDVEVDEKPKYQTINPTEKSHAIVAKNRSNNHELIIHLQLKGVASCFDTRKPTTQEYEAAEAAGDVYDLTSEGLTWNPLSDHFAEQEAAMMDHKGEVKPHRNKKLTICQIDSSLRLEENTYYLEREFATALENNVNLDTRPVRQVASVASMVSEKRPKLEPALLAKRWGIGLEAAKHTIARTTQRGVRTVLHPTLSRRFRTNDRQLRYRRLPIDVFTDTMFSTADKKSRRQNTCAQIFYARNGWCRAFPMRLKSQAHEALSLLFARDGVPRTMIGDNAWEMMLGDFKRKCREADCNLRTTEAHTQKQNAAEVGVKELKLDVLRELMRTGAPRRLWDDCLEFRAYVRSLTWRDVYALDGEVPETMVTGQTADISQFCELAWYDWVMFLDTAQPFPNQPWVLGRYLGPSIDVGPAMTGKFLLPNGEVMHRTTYRGLKPDEEASPLHIKEREAFDVQVHIKLGEKATPDMFEDVHIPDYPLYEDDDGNHPKPVPDAEDEVTPETVADAYLNAEVNLPIGGQMKSGQVKRRKLDTYGNLKGTKHNNPMMDTRTYEVEFPDGEVSEYTANAIAENMWAQCDADGRQHVMMDEIVDVRKTQGAVEVADKYVEVKGKQHLKKTTRGWEFCVQWKDSTTSWARLADLKESNPIEVAEYAMAQGIDHEPAFAWWVPHTLRKRSRIIAAVSKRYFKRTHKFGIKIPKTVAEAQAFDKENGDTLWMDALEKEMSNVRIAFKILEDGEDVPVAHERITGHLIWDVKMEDFRRKARYVADGHKTAAPDSSVYAGVVSRETVRIALTIAALNDLDVMTSDIQNAFLTAPCEEKCWIILGPEFGADEGKSAVIVRALYGLRKSGKSFRDHLANCMKHCGYTPCKADPDLWYKEMCRPSDGLRYYGYMLLYIDDALCISHQPSEDLHKLDKYFKMKDGSIAEPSIYLGAKVKLDQMENGVFAWGMSPCKYVKEAVKNVEAHLRRERNRGLGRRTSSPYPTDYSAEIDTSPLLSTEDATYFQSQIGILRWMVELGRVDIIVEVSVLSSFLAMPREGHLEAVFHIYSYLKRKKNSRMVFDPTPPDIDMDVFKQCDWKNTYGDCKEAIPSDMPEPLGKEVDLRLYCDSSHADDEKTRRSRSGYFIFLNSAPIAWLAKKQATIETSVFGAEFVAMKIGMEALRGIRYKLRMMGVPISGPSYIYGDNMSVIHNTQSPDSMLKKKSNSICYHAVRESVAMGESLTGHVSTHENVSDLCTKIMAGGMKREYLVSKVLHDIYDPHGEDDDDDD